MSSKLQFLFYILFLLRRAISPSPTDWFQRNNFDNQLFRSEAIKVIARKIVKITSVSGTLF